MNNFIWPIGTNPVPLVSGDEPVFTATINGATALDVTSATMTIYKNNSSTDHSATHLVSGDSVTASGNQVTLKKITALTGGATYVVAFSLLVDGVLTFFKFALSVQKKEALP
jgi:hypothetical protein